MMLTQDQLVEVWEDVLKTAAESMPHSNITNLACYFSKRYENNRRQLHDSTYYAISDLPLDGRTARFGAYVPRREVVDAYQMSHPLMFIATAPEGSVMTVSYKGVDYRVTVPDKLTCIDFELTPPGDEVVREYVEAMLHLHVAEAKWIRRQPHGIAY